MLFGRALPFLGLTRDHTRGQPFISSTHLVVQSIGLWFKIIFNDVTENKVPHQLNLFRDWIFKAWWLCVML